MALLNRPSRVLPTAPIVETAGRAPGLGLASSVEGLRGVRKREFCASVNCTTIQEEFNEALARAAEYQRQAAALPELQTTEIRRLRRLADEQWERAVSLSTTFNLCCVH